MLVTVDIFDDVVRRFSQEGLYGFDTEAYGLKHSDDMFSFQLSDDNGPMYFDCTDPRMPILSDMCLTAIRTIFNNPKSTFFIHNAKFDMRRLAMHGIEIKGTIWDTEVIARLIKNNLPIYTLDACAKRIGLKKDDKVKEYIQKHKLFTVEQIPGKKKKSKNLHFDKVPLDLMIPYAEQDAVVVRDLGLWQMDYLKLRQDSSEWSRSTDLVANEQRLTKTCARIEDRGITINVPYVQEAKAYMEGLLEEETRNFERISGLPFKDSSKLFKEAFDSLGEEYTFTKLGNACFNKKALAKYSGELPDSIKKIRLFNLYIGTYYASFLYHKDVRHAIHANIRQSGTESGRFSYSNPNLQNIPKEEECLYPYRVRGSFTPRQDYCFCMLDYDQQEFRMMLDYAGETSLIQKINEGNLDVHQATADELGVSRKHAKTLNFGLLYGMGVEKLAEDLKLPIEQAEYLKRLYFSKLPRVQTFINDVIRTGKQRRVVYNWFGRRCYIASTDLAYILPNHIIQGGGADIIKIAMNKIDDLLLGTRSSMLIQCHDEVLLEIHKDELDLVPKIKTIMESVYIPRNGMKLTVGVDHSWKSWGYDDLVGGLPL